jgi:hypothetical protein
MSSSESSKSSTGSRESNADTTEVEVEILVTNHDDDVDDFIQPYMGEPIADEEWSR